MPIFDQPGGLGASTLTEQNQPMGQGGLQDLAARLIMQVQDPAGYLKLRQGDVENRIRQQAADTQQQQANTQQQAHALDRLKLLLSLSEEGLLNVDKAGEQLSKAANNSGIAITPEEATNIFKQPGSTVMALTNFQQQVLSGMPRDQAALNTLTKFPASKTILQLFGKEAVTGNEPKEPPAPTEIGLGVIAAKVDRNQPLNKREMDMLGAATPQQARAIVKQFQQTKVAERVAQVKATQEALNPPTNIPLGATGEAVFVGVPADEARVAKGIANYQLPLPGGFALRSPYWQRILALATAYDPNFDATKYVTRQRLRTDFASGKGGQNIRSLNTAVNHLDELENAGKTLQNSSIQLWNTIRNVGLAQSGDPRITRFNTAATAVESELSSVFKGTGATDQEIKVWRQNISSSQSPQQIEESIHEAVRLLAGRLDALRNQYESGMGKFDLRILSPQSKRILTKLGLNISPFEPTSGDIGTQLNPEVKSSGPPKILQIKPIAK